jgi:hypothetical protein
VILYYRLEDEGVDSRLRLAVEFCTLLVSKETEVDG